MIKVGLDYHTRRSYLSILNEGGTDAQEGSIDTALLPGLFEDLGEAEVLFEAGYGWPRLVKLLEGSKVELKMCHAGDNRRIANDRRKSDRRDAANLAVYLRTGTYKPVFMPDDGIRDERQLVRSRAYTVRKITRMKNQIQSLLAYAGVQKPAINIFAAKNRYYFDTIDLRENTREALNANLESYDFHLEILKRLDDRIAEMNRKDPRARLLKTIPGVGEVTAGTLLSEIGDIGRFRTAKSLACYTGLSPGQRQSGSSTRMSGITKEGSSHIRSVMVQAAWVAIRLDPALREFYEELKQRKTAQKAICAVARKLVVSAWYILKKQVPYKARKPMLEDKPGVARGTISRKAD